MTTRRQLKEIISKLKFEKAPLNHNPGRIIRDPIARKLNRKDRKHSGHRIFYADDFDYPVMLDTYDEWRNHRDGMRDKSKVLKNIYPQMFWHDEDFYWEARKKGDKMKIKEKIRRLRKENYSMIYTIKFFLYSI